MRMLRSLLFVVAAAAAPPAFAAGPGGLDRIGAWETVETYNYQSKQFSDRYSKWAHEAANADKSQADFEQESGLKRADPAPALKAALQVAQANPTDDLGFMALQFCFYTSRQATETDRQACRAVVFDALEKHYLDDPRLGALTLGLARFGGKEGIALLNRVVEQSHQPELQAQAAYWSAAERIEQIDDLSIPAAERAAVRADVTRLTQLIADRFADVPMRGGTAGAAVKPMLYTLEHLSIGSVLPDASALRIGGKEEKLSQYRGKVVLLDFWATWCVPCVHSLPKVVKLKEELKGRPFEVITLSIDKSADTVQDFMKKRMELPFVNWHIGDHSDLYRNWDLHGVPTYILVDRKGVIQGRTHEVETLQDLARKLAGR